MAVLPFHSNKTVRRMHEGTNYDSIVDIFCMCKIVLRFCGMLSRYLQAMFNEFSTANIQIDKDFSAKLSGYGCINHIPETEIRNSSVVSALG